MIPEKEKSHNAYLGLGSNLGDRGGNLETAIGYIEERIGEIAATSAFYVTDPVGFDSDNRFLNAACLVRTKLSPADILQTTRTIEKEMGRRTKSQNDVYSDRIIDIDILLYDNEILESPGLTLPHPRLHERAFVLYPLAEIGGKYTHPVLHKTIDELKELLSTPLSQSRENGK
jgi:2-amino-4-hydroxy-6-hydroxymethyldihydropteridine diphosphokinase